MGPVEKTIDKVQYLMTHHICE